MLLYYKDYNQQDKVKRTGFTLIELLVVIAIIGLLSTISIFALNQARSKARDARRTADMRQLVTALDMYYDQNGGYPPLSDTDATGYDNSADGNFMRGLAATGLISPDMDDPSDKGGNFLYYYFTPDYPAIGTYCPGDVKARLRLTLENDTSLVGFATPNGGSAATGYIWSICLY